MTPLAPGSSIGFIGLGRMGQPMVRRLVEAGFVVRAYDADPAARERSRRNTRAEVLDTLEVLAGSCGEVLILMLPSSAAVEGLLLREGLLELLPTQTIVVDMGSSEPTSTRRLAERAEERQLRYVDAPVSGGVLGAESGSLSVMVGGAQEDIAHCRPLFDVLGSQVFAAGEIGAGHAVKALNNLLSATSLMISAEALSIGRRLGLDPEVMLEVINASSGRSASSEYKLPRFVLSEEFNSGFALSLMVKDLNTAIGLRDPVPGSSLLSGEVLRLWGRAEDELPVGADHTEIARWVEGQLPDPLTAQSGSSRRRG
jgi:3-hydroxyisobutyrate dehydrogenase